MPVAPPPPIITINNFSSCCQMPPKGWVRIASSWELPPLPYIYTYLLQQPWYAVDFLFNFHRVKHRLHWARWEINLKADSVMEPNSNPPKIPKSLHIHQVVLPASIHPSPTQWLLINLYTHSLNLMLKVSINRKKWISQLCITTLIIQLYFRPYWWFCLTRFIVWLFINSMTVYKGSWENSHEAE